MSEAWISEDLLKRIQHAAIDRDIAPTALVRELLGFFLAPNVMGGGPPPPDGNGVSYVRANHVRFADLYVVLPDLVASLLPVATVSANSKKPPTAVAPSGEFRVPPAIVDGAIAVLREWRNDGADGESAHLVCDALLATRNWGGELGSWYPIFWETSRLARK